MLEPFSLVALALGQAAAPLIRKAAEKHVENFFGERLQDLAKLGKKKPTVDAMERAWAACVELILDNIRVQRSLDREEVADDEGMRAVAQALRRFIEDRAVGTELLKPILELDPDAPRRCPSCRRLAPRRWSRDARKVLVEHGG